MQMIHKPFFSITIPTYNRPADLKKAIKSFLFQDFTDYEIVVSDNSDNNDSERICNSFKDNRIKYSRNKANIGFARNLYKAIKRAKGKYVFLFGDDDLILKPDSLLNIHKLFQKNHFGYIRLKFLYHKNMDYIFDFNKAPENAIKILKKGSSSLETLHFAYRYNFSLISGNIFLNSSSFSIPILEKTTDSDFLMESFWLKFIFRQAQNYGAYFDKEDVILVKWIIQTKNLAGASSKTPGIYDVVDNKIYVEKTWALMSSELTKDEKKEWINEQSVQMIPLLTSVKYYSSNKNLLLYINRMLELNNDLRRMPGFYLFLIIALLMPKFLWNKLRGIVQKYNIVHDLKIDNHLQNLKGSLFNYKVI